ncbi:MAG: hypothetical protein KIS85_04780 [Anaerolineales bacterium]|nr:hypothetical protein [Anaerolineales bacterium]
MSSTLLWILLPLAVGVALLAYRGKATWLPALLGGALCLFLAWVAAELPLGVVMQLGPFTTEIAPTMVLFGRSFTLDNAHTPILTLLYLLQALWLFGVHLAKPGRLFVPLSLICLALLVGALAVQPFLYAALLLAMAALLLVPLLSPPGSHPGLGVQRYLQFQVFAVPFILFTGWILSGVEANPNNLTLVLRAGLLLALGFGFLLALFPFHGWVPVLAGQSHPYVFGFLILFLPSVAMVFGLGFFDRYGWLRDGTFTGALLLAAGGLMALLGGAWAASERHMGRLFGYATMVAGGYSIQAIGLGGAAGVQAFFALLIPQGLAIWAWAAALSRLPLPEEGAADLSEVTQGAPKHPLALAVLLAALACLAGLPLLGSFSGRLAVLQGAATVAPWAAVFSLLGSLGLLVAGGRVLAAALAASLPRPPGWVEEAQPELVDKSSDLYNPYVWAFAVVSALALLGGGLFPQLFWGMVPRLAALFSQLFP